MQTVEKKGFTIGYIVTVSLGSQSNGPKFVEIVKQDVNIYVWWNAPGVC